MTTDQTHRVGGWPLGDGPAKSHYANPPRVRIYRGVIIEPRNYCGMYSARIDVAGGGVRVAADTLAGIRSLITDTLATEGRTHNDA